MNKLTKKDWLIIGLFFVLVYVASSLASCAFAFRYPSCQGILSEDIVASIFIRSGYALTYPIMFLFVTPLRFLTLVGFQPSLGEPLMLLPLVVSLIYTSVLLCSLGIYNSYHSKKSSSKK